MSDGEAVSGQCDLGFHERCRFTACACACHEVVHWAAQ